MNETTCRDCEKPFDPTPMTERLEQLKAEGKISEVYPPTRCRECGIKRKRERQGERNPDLRPPASY